MEMRQLQGQRDRKRDRQTLAKTDREGERGRERATGQEVCILVFLASSSVSVCMILERGKKE